MDHGTTAMGPETASPVSGVEVEIAAIERWGLQRPAATAAPPEEPPGVFVASQGLRVIPRRGLSVTAFHPNSG